MGKINEDLLTHFLVIFGHIAIRQMNYLDRDILAELKKRNAAEMKNKTKNSRPSSVKGKLNNLKIKYFLRCYSRYPLSNLLIASLVSLE
jgi:hypothetical protein